jgi:tetratricopeptide (TPR) repeat protein
MVRHVSKALLVGVAIACSFGCPMMSFGPVSALAMEQSLNQQFKAQEDQALAATRNHEKSAMHLWNQLASAEIGAGLTPEGLEHERHAMQLYSSEDVGEFGVLGYLGSRIIPTLTAQGHSVQAEQLLIEAVERIRIVAGPKSVATQAQLGDLFLFYVRQKHYLSALRILDQVLDFDLSNGEAPSQSLTHFVNVNRPLQPNSSVAVLHSILVRLQKVEKAEPSFIIIALEKVLKAQEVHLTAHDERLIESLAALGDAYFQAKKYKEADGYYNRAFEITKQYYPEGGFAVQQCGINFLVNLKEVGRSEESDRLSKLKWEGMQSLNSPSLPFIPHQF